MSTHLRLISKLPSYLIAIPLVLGMRAIRPWCLFRLGLLTGDRLGHFAANVEIYLCERDAGINIPKQKYIDLFTIYEPICNMQLALMWGRILRILPLWLMAPMMKINRLIPGWKIHEVGTNTQGERDIFNLLDRYPGHLTFTESEEDRGRELMRSIGISSDAKLVCLIVRDSAYLESHKPGNWSGHDFRDSDIKNYVLTAEELEKRGYTIIRMGAKVRSPLQSNSSRIIDYAYKELRSDFLDIFLASKCEFCISTGTGWDAVPAWLFRKPTVFVNESVIGMTNSYSHNFIIIPKNYHNIKLQRDLTLREIFEMGVGFCFRTADLNAKDIKLTENSPEEILSVTIEMVERLNGVWEAYDEDAKLRSQFLEIYNHFAIDSRSGHPVHGKFNALIGAEFLRTKKDWLQ
jgi:putative glycosyltransferase (TIGR04372 family)